MKSVQELLQALRQMVCSRGQGWLAFHQQHRSFELIGTSQLFGDRRRGAQRSPLTTRPLGHATQGGKSMVVSIACNSLADKGSSTAVLFRRCTTQRPLRN